MAYLIPNYFFLDKKLYKKIRVVKSEDYVVAWSYEDERRMRFNFSSVRKEAGKAYNLDEVSRLIDKRKSEILSYLKRNLVDQPSGRLYSIKNKRPGKWMWSEKDILDLRESIFDMAPKNKYGEPFRNFKLVSKAELLSRMREDTSYYVRNENGEFVKVWRAI
jgi:hypothetical protein